MESLDMNFSNYIVRLGLLLVIGLFVASLSGWSVEADKDLILYYHLTRIRQMSVERKMMAN